MPVFPYLLLLNDDKVMLRVKEHEDHQAFNVLVKRWEMRIQRLCWRLTGNEHFGEDLAQVAFMRLFTKRKNYQGGGSFAAYLKRIAVNACHDQQRRRLLEKKQASQVNTPHEATLDFTASKLNSSPDAVLVREENYEMVKQALFQLPQEYRQVVILRHYEELTFREIAEILELPVGTVKSRMAEALNKLRIFLNPVLDNPLPNKRRAQGKNQKKGEQYDTSAK